MGNEDMNDMNKNPKSVNININGDVRDSTIIVGNDNSLSRDEHSASSSQESSFQSSLTQNKETLISNLLPISEISGQIYSAPINLTKRNFVFPKLLSVGGKPYKEFILRRNEIVSFHNLKEHPWSAFCNPKAVKVSPVSEWADTRDQDKLNEFIELLGHALTQKLEPNVIRDETEGYYYFAPTPNLSPIELPYQSLKKATSRWVFRDYTKISDKTKTAYYRHSAFWSQFRRFDNQWFLEITPHYKFTINGHMPSKYSSSLLKKIKQLELNPAVLGQVVMWAEYLRDKPDLFTQSYPFINFGKLRTFETNIGINDESWLGREDKEAEIAQAINDSTNDLPLFSFESE